MEKVRLVFSFLLITALCAGCGTSESEINAETKIAETTAIAETPTEMQTAETEQESVSESISETVSETESETMTETFSETAESDTQTEPETEPEQESTAETLSNTRQKSEMIAQTMGRNFSAETQPVPEPETEPQTVAVSNLQISTISVSCLKVTWDSDRDVTVTVETEAPYQENIYQYFKTKNLLYLTGLRENFEYTVHVTPIVVEGETAQTETVTGHTEQVVVVYNFDEDEEAYAQYKDSGVLYATDFFAGERSTGLTAQPASGAIAGAVNDPVTDTGICRDEYGDYCVAMGQYFGQDWDRYLITMQNGQQITVKQCDDKGMRWYHEVGNDDTNRNIVEFIYYGSSMPSGVRTTGTWGSFFWNGLAFSHIQSIQKIEYPENTVEY